MTSIRLTSKEIQAKAFALLVESQATDLPINLHKVANHLRIRIALDRFDEATSGLLVLKDGVAVIGVNKDHHPNRQRFTIAHEIGHFVLHHSLFSDNNGIHIAKKWAYFRSVKEDSDKNQEYEANVFAAELLIPERPLKSLISASDFDLSNDVDTSQLARTLQVSEQALAIRLVNLKLVKPY